MTKNDVRKCFLVKKIISNSEQRAEQAIAGRNTQHSYHLNVFTVKCGCLTIVTIEQVLASKK